MCSWACEDDRDIRIFLWRKLKRDILRISGLVEAKHVPFLIGSIAMGAAPTKFDAKAVPQPLEKDFWRGKGGVTPCHVPNTGVVEYGKGWYPDVACYISRYMALAPPGEKIAPCAVGPQAFDTSPRAIVSISMSPLLLHRLLRGGWVSFGTDHCRYSNQESTHYTWFYRPFYFRGAIWFNAQMEIPQAEKWLEVHGQS